MHKFNSLYITQGRGTPFIFLHGLGSSIHQTTRICDGIKGIKFISMDFPGHGRTRYPEDGKHPSFQYYSDDLVLLMEKLKVDEAYVGGISMGAGIALTLASQYPDRVKGLVLVRPAWLEESAPDNLRILSKVSEMLTKSFAREKFQQTSYYRKLHQNLPGAALSLLGLFAPTQQPTLSKTLWHMVSDHPELNYDSINNANIPACVIGNSHDPLHPIEMAQNIHKNLANSKFHKVISRYKSDDKHRRELVKIISNFIKQTKD